MREEILVLGDSHAVVFKSVKIKSHFSNITFTVLDVRGATVSGLSNPNSITQAMPLFDLALNASTARRVIFLIGEVDTGFIIWYGAEKYKTSVSVLLDKAIENYQILITKASKKSSVICISTPLPTIQDDNDWGEVADARKNIRATQLQRTKLTLAFNKRMREFCETNGHNFYHSMISL